MLRQREKWVTRSLGRSKHGLFCVNNGVIREPRFLPTPSPEQFVQLICEAEERQAELLEIVQPTKAEEKRSEVPSLKRFQGDVTQSKAVQVDHLSQKGDDFTQISLIHFQVLNAPQIQKLQDTFVPRHSIDLQISAADVQGPNILLNFTTKEREELLCSQGTIEGNIH